MDGGKDLKGFLRRIEHGAEATTAPGVRYRIAVFQRLPVARDGFARDFLGRWDSRTVTFGSYAPVD